MKRNHWILAGCLSAAMLSVGVVGCGAPETDGQPSASGDNHNHGEEGPHHGALIELGEYHAELMHDEAAGGITVYILDGTGKNSHPIDATEITINLKHDGQGEQFSLVASPESGDPAGKASRFVSTESELMADLDREEADAELVVEINGVRLRGEIGHHHHDDDHDHDHE